MSSFHFGYMIGGDILFHVWVSLCNLIFAFY